MANLLFEVEQKVEYAVIYDQFFFAGLSLKVSTAVISFL